MRLCLGLTLLVLMAHPSGAYGADKIQFNRDIRALLSSKCLSCHGRDAKKREAGLRLDMRQSAVGKLESGKHAIVPGRPLASELIRRITSSDKDTRMPPSGSALTSKEVSILKQWIQQGARYAKHWSLIPPRKRVLPKSKLTGWRQPVDTFISSRLRAAGLQPNRLADRFTLIRRLSLDLRGLPPTSREVDQFIGDQSNDAYSKLIDRFLADKAYGERLARTWLDLARYADSRGYGSDPLRMNAWRYRDWLIEALNNNLSYDKFTIYQIAGDLLPKSTLNQKVATAFHRNTMTNVEGGTDDEEFRVAAVKDRVDTTMQVWMGLTMGCAKCHNHKYDPITQQEYYQFFDFFNQTADADRGDESPFIKAPSTTTIATNKRIDQQIAQLRSQLAGASWSTAKIAKLTSTGGAKLSQQSDGSVLASGKSSARDKYVIEVTSTGGADSAIRLEAIPDKSLPASGSGRGPRGQFVLSQIHVTAEPLNAKPTSAKGRFIRIDLPGQRRILSLAEVQVFSGGKNVARGGQARQSSTAFAGPPRLAIDGNTNGNFAAAKSVTHTNTETNPWWELDLKKSVPVDQLRIWNRTDNRLQSRLTGYRVQLLDAKRNIVWSTAPRGFPNPSSELSTSQTRRVQLIEASASYSQPKFPVSGSLSGSAQGWAVGPQQSKRHTAMFLFDQPVRHAGGTRFTIHLQHTYGKTNQALGRFRFSLSKTRLKSVRAKIAKLEKSRPKIPTLPIMQELPLNRRRPTYVMMRGSFLSQGAKVQAGTPSSLHSFRSYPKNRLGVAYWLVDRNNPLTARVAVNRIWARLFGTGLVETEEDFGSQGELPSHPELLDWLAVDFMQHDWDVKRIIKSIVMSATYQQTAVLTAKKLSLDPRNRLLSRAPRFRLDAETIRDQALAISGLLSRKMYGPSVYPFQPGGLWRAAFNGQRTWPTSKGEDKFRRGLYTFWRRTVPYPSMATFDAPSREICSMRRIRTNTPLQALVTMNDPVYVEASQAFAKRILKGGKTTQERIQFAWKLCRARPASDRQTAILLRLFRSELEHYQRNKNAATALLGLTAKSNQVAEQAAWVVVANVLLNMDGVLTKG